MTRFGDLFTPRQLLALNTFSDLVTEARIQVLTASTAETSLYPNAVATYLAFAGDKAANYWSAACSWHQTAEKMVSTFGLPVLPIVWDYTEANAFSTSTGNWMLGIEQASKSLDSAPAISNAYVVQRDAAKQIPGNARFLISTDPPYYDNVPYADLSDFFYVWMRRALDGIYPDLFRTLLVPKAEEIVASTHRVGGNKAVAKAFFEQQLGLAFHQVNEAQHDDFPLTIFYAFRQTETSIVSDSRAEQQVATASTGWETMLEGLLGANFTIVGTWPMRTEQQGGLRISGRNALASSIVLVCRPRLNNARVATRREFIAALRHELPLALKNLQHGNVAPVDLAQAAIGPGMAIYSRFAKVLEADGSAMRVRIALQLINQALDEILTEQDGEYDADTRWAIAWFDQYALDEGPFGMAETLSKAKNTAIVGLATAGIISSRPGYVRLLRRDELPADWNPLTDTRLTVWETAQHLIHALDTGGEVAAATLLRQIGPAGEMARDLAYRLYTTCERKGWAAEARAYNSLVVAWPQITQRSGEPSENEQMRLLPR